jgi:hypothetical protein
MPSAAELLTILQTSGMSDDDGDNDDVVVVRTSRLWKFHYNTPVTHHVNPYNRDWIINFPPITS